MIMILAGCESVNKYTASSSLAQRVSYRQASGQARSYAHFVVKTVSPSARATAGPFGDEPTIAYCSNSDDPPKGTPVNIEYDYKLEGITPGEVKTYFKNFRTHLEGDGWKHLYGSYSGKAVALSRDDYTVLLQYAPSNHLLSLGVTSPCVSPKDPNHPLAP